MASPARVRPVTRAPPPRSPPMFCTLAPNAIRSKTAIATPTSPAQASTFAPAPVSRTYLTEVPKAKRLVRNTSDERPSRSVARTRAPVVSRAAAPTPQDSRPARRARAPDATALPPEKCWYPPSTERWRMVAMPAGFEKTAPASPTSGAPAPPSPAARVEPGRLSQAPPPDWAASEDTNTAWRTSVEGVLNASPSRHLSLNSNDGQPRRERCPERPARGVAEQQSESRSASALLGAEVHPRPSAQHVAQVQGAPGADAWYERKARGNAGVRGSPGARIRAPAAQQWIVRPEPPHLVLQLGRGRETREIGDPVRQCPALDQPLEHLSGLRCHILWAAQARDVELAGECTALRERRIRRVLVDQVAQEQPVRAAVR